MNLFFLQSANAGFPDFKILPGICSLGLDKRHEKAGHIYCPYNDEMYCLISEFISKVCLLTSNGVVLKVRV